MKEKILKELYNLMADRCDQCSNAGYEENENDYASITICENICYAHKIYKKIIKMLDKYNPKESSLVVAAPELLEARSKRSYKQMKEAIEKAEKGAR